MLTILFYYIKLILVPALYAGGMGVALYTAFKRAEVGLFLFVFLLPLPNVWFKFHQYPLGEDFLDILFVSIVLGIAFQKKGFGKTDNTIVLITFIIVSYVALWNNTLRADLAVPFSGANPFLKPWKDYAFMVGMYFLVVSVIKKEEQQKQLLMLMSFVILLLSVRSYRSFTGGSSFSDTSRYAGSFWVVGLGSNHFGAFITYAWAGMLGMFLMDKDKRRKWLYMGASLFALHPIFFSYSRGAYAAAAGALTIMGLLKKRILLVAVFIIAMTWQTVLPASVVDRIMTSQTESGDLEHAAAIRLELWDRAVELFDKNPIFGVGFGGFRHTTSDGVMYTDTHNFYLKMLCEQGIIGLSLTLIVLLLSYRSGWLLFRQGSTQFQKALGFAFLGMATAHTLTNIFGDRWSYFILGGYFWIFWGLVDRGRLISMEAQKTAATTVDKKAVPGAS